MSAGLECIGKVVFGKLSEDFAAAAELLVRLRVPARLRIALVARLRLLVAALRVSVVAIAALPTAGATRGGGPREARSSGLIKKEC